MKTPPVSKLFDAPTSGALKEVQNAIGPIWELDNAERWEPPELDRRITWGVGKRKGKLIISLIVDKTDSSAERIAQDLVTQFPNQTKLITGGNAQSSKTTHPASKQGLNEKREIRPGVSIGHPRGTAGTLGLIVRRAGEIKKGAIQEDVFVMTAAHVISLSKQTEVGDGVYSPGKPDCGISLKLKDRIGHLEDTTVLTHYTDDDFMEPQDHTIDVALVRVDTKKWKVPDKNYVPHPLNPTKKKLVITKVMSCDKLWKLLGSKVYKIGRTTGFTSGTLEYSNIQKRLFKLPNGKNYLYGNLIAIKPLKNDPFSLPGDSGAVIYTDEGVAVGFVVGADDIMTYGCSAEKAFSDFKVELI